MALVGGTGIDDGDVAAADDVADRALEGERARVVAHDAAHAGHHLVHRFGGEIELLVEGDVVAHIFAIFAACPRAAGRDPGLGHCGWGTSTIPATLHPRPTGCPLPAFAGRTRCPLPTGANESPARECPERRQEIEIAAFVGLADVLRIHGAVAARVTRRRLFPGGAAARQLLVRHVQMDAALVDIDLDLVAGLHEGERTADEAFRRHVQDAGAVAGAAHARVGNAQHVLDALLQQLARDRQHAPLRHAGPAERTAALQHDDVVGVTSRSSRSISRAMWL